ncbi:DHA2 family efflux MFS transporter permease subunit [Sinosporangium siamense]|uniref:DHA2 family efflux MFS transporter permease subunit n=1 Tax=Sinosporangium siamense TaxID=1367973 RepID=UPI001EF354D4|nr:DHA2 family efflux MFS transporter permease subunit [Sinosporangium siamense]
MASDKAAESPVPAEQEAGHPRRWAILAVMVFSLLAVVLDNTILNVALRTIADPVHGLGATQGELEWAINSYSLVFAGLLFTFGVLGDRNGRKRIMMLGMVIFGLSSLASAYAQDPGQLIVARAFMGIGGAAIMPATLAIISNVFPPRERGQAIGIWAGGVGLAVAIGPVAGGLLLEHFWWGSVFLVNVPVVAISVVLIALMVPESRDPNPARLDPAGVLLSIVGMIALVYGIIHGGERGTVLEAGVWGPTLIGLLVLIIFVVYESRSDHPAFDVRYFRLPMFSTAVTTLALAFFGMMGVMFLLAFYFQVVRGYGPLEAGLMMLPFAVAQLIFGPLSAGMVQRFGPRVLATVSLIVVTGTLLALAFLQADTPVWLVLLISFVQGAAMANIMPPATTAILQALPRHKAGVGSAMSNTIRQVGGALGVAILGSVLAAVYRDEIAPALAGFPAAVRETAGESITATYVLAERAGPQAGALMEAANSAFMDGLRLALIVASAVSLAATVIVGRWLPGKAAAEALTPQAQPEATGGEPARV